MILREFLELTTIPDLIFSVFKIFELILTLSAAPRFSILNVIYSVSYHAYIFIFDYKTMGENPLNFLGTWERMLGNIEQTKTEKWTL